MEADISLGHPSLFLKSRHLVGVFHLSLFAGDGILPDPTGLELPDWQAAESQEIPVSASPTLDTSGFRIKLWSACFCDQQFTSWARSPSCASTNY